MTRGEAIEILRDTPIDIRSTREDDIHTLYATAQNMAIEALSVNPKAVVCRECVEYKSPNGMDMICALWNEEVFSNHSCEWGKRREDDEEE